MSGCAVTEVGMVSALGHDAANAFAAARAGLTRVVPLDVKNFVEEEKWEGEPVYGHCVPVIGKGFVGRGKAILLGEYALRDLIRKLERRRVNLQRTAYFLHLSDRSMLEEARFRTTPTSSRKDTAEAVSGSWRQQGDSILRAILSRSGLESGAAECHVAFGDHAEIAALLDAASAALRNGHADSCVVGAVDSTVEPQCLDAAADLLMLRTAKYPAGFTPGEAGVFVLLQRGEDVAAGHAGARIAAIAFARESLTYLTEERPTGAGLARVVEAVCERGSDRKPALPGLLIGDLNGWEVRSADWGGALARLMPDLDFSQVPLWLPAASFGETGAATGLVSTAMAVEALRRGYLPGRDSLVCLASLAGERSAIRLESLK